MELGQKFIYCCFILVVLSRFEVDCDFISINLLGSFNTFNLVNKEDKGDPVLSVIPFQNKRLKMCN